jgi:hypothetical protein
MLFYSVPFYELFELVILGIDLCVNDFLRLVRNHQLQSICVSGDFMHRCQSGDSLTSSARCRKLLLLGKLQKYLLGFARVPELNDWLSRFDARRESSDRPKHCDRRVLEVSIDRVLEVSLST